MKDQMNDTWLEIIDLIHTGTVIAGVLLDFSCIKYRWLARMIYPLEVFAYCYNNILPSGETCLRDNEASMFYTFFITVSLACDIRLSLLLNVVAAIFQMITRSLGTVLDDDLK